MYYQIIQRLYLITSKVHVRNHLAAIPQYSNFKNQKEGRKKRIGNYGTRHCTKYQIINAICRSILVNNLETKLQIPKVGSYQQYYKKEGKELYHLMSSKIFEIAWDPIENNFPTSHERHEVLTSPICKKNFKTSIQFK